MKAKEERTTVSLGREAHELLTKIAGEHEWSVGETTALAIRTLKAVMDEVDDDQAVDETAAVAARAWKLIMDAHQTFAAQYATDQGELYMRLASEMPAGFVEVPKDGVRLGRAGDLPVVRVDNWFVFPDPKTGALLAEDRGGEGRVARIVDGEIKPLRLPSADEVALN
jgi:hypothetical protein